jgi:hypothetical protein
MHEQDDRTPGLISHSGGRLSDDEWQARAAAPVESTEDAETVTRSAGLPPRGSAESEDPRYAEVRTIASGGYLS